MATPSVARRRAWFAAAGALVVGFAGLHIPSVAQAPVSVSIDTVDGQDASSGSLAQPVTGDTLAATGRAQIEPGVLADAGASVAGPVGSDLPVTGLASFGTAPYTFAWSYDGSPSRFRDPSAQSTAFASNDLSPGEAVLTLTVTDATGATDTDTVKVFLQAPFNTTTLDHRGEIGPGLPDEFIGGENTEGSTQRIPFDVPNGTDTLTLTLAWSTSENDLDLRVDDPSDVHDANTSAATGANPEVMTLSSPTPADGWVAIVEAFLNTPEEYTLKAEVTGKTPDPTPILDAGGPYNFRPGAPQELTASVDGGTAPVELSWDLDGDNVFETAGPTATTDFGLGTHLVTVKAVDAAGYEKRETLGVRVADAEIDGSPGLAVVAIADSGLNVYHRDFRASTYRDEAIKNLTANFTRHPSEYLDGYPANAPAIDLTLTDEYHPAADKVVDPDDGRTTLAEVVENKLYWIPGTKIIGAYDSGEAVFVNSTAGDEVPILDEDGHGTGSASVAVGNLYGYCPSCLLVVTEAPNPNWEYGIPWIDIASNSFGSLGNIGSAGAGAPEVPKESAERGQIAMYAAGNGNENAFVTPQQTYTSDTLGPDWVVRVGAVTTGSRKPIVGTGKPVDIASFGSGDIPAADNTSVNGLGSHSGTSAATPYSAGVFGTVLGIIRSKLGDTTVGQHPDAGQGVIARGLPLPGSPYLFDGVLTRTELVDAIFKTAQHEGSGMTAEYPVTTPPESGYQYAFEGYGLVEPASGARALDVLLGFAPLPERPEEDEFFAEDERIRDDMWGDWGGAGEDSSTRADAPQWKPRVDPLEGKTFAAAITSPKEGQSFDPASQERVHVAGQSIFPPLGTIASTQARFYPHRVGAPGATACAQPYTETMDREDRSPDCEVGYTFQSTGLQPSEEYLASEDLTLGSGAASGIIYVEGTTPSAAHELTITLKGSTGGRTVVLGSDVVSGTSTPVAPTEFPFSIDIPTERAGVTFDNVVLSVKISRSTSANSKSSLDAPASFVDLPLANEGAVPQRRVELSLDDPTFAAPVVAERSDDDRTFEGSFAGGALEDGTHAVFARAMQGDAVSEVSSRTFTVARSRTASATPAVVQAQITEEGADPVDASWTAVTSTASAGQDPFETWTADLSIASLVPGNYVLHTRVLDDGAATATDRVSFRRASATSDDGTSGGATGGSSGGGSGGGDGEAVPSAAEDRGKCADTRTKTTGYWMVDSAGRVYGFGSADHVGNAPVGTAQAVDLEATPTGDGYWILDDVGHVFSFGDASYHGGVSALASGERATSLSSTPCGDGYWIFTNRGRAVPFGDARFLGDMSGVTLNGPVLDSIATPSGDGYFMVASDGGIFTFGDAAFEGSMGSTPLNAPVQSLVPDADNRGYWLVASDGGIFTFEADFRGSMGDRRLNGPVTGMVRYADGYLMVAEDGGIFNFSSEEFLGSLGDNPPDRPVTSVSAAYGSGH